MSRVAAPLVAVVAVVAVVAGASPATARRVTVTTQNVRVSLDPARARHDIRQAAEHSSVVFTQEMGKRVARRFAPAGWGTAHRPGLRRGDCAVYWSRAVWRHIATTTREVTRAPFRAGHRWALAVTLEDRATRARVGFVCVHLITRSALRPVVYAAGIRRVHALAGELRRRGPVIVGGDWNHGPYGIPATGFGSTWGTAATSRLTTARARLDWFHWTRPALELEAIRRIGPTYSDHDGVRLTLRGPDV